MISKVNKQKVEIRRKRVDLSVPCGDASPGSVNEHQPFLFIANIAKNAVVQMPSHSYSTWNGPTC